MIGKTLAGRYQIVHHLGGGGFGQTFIAEDKHLPDNPRCIIKQLKPSSTQGDVLRLARNFFDQEAKILYRLGRHDQIPTLLAHFEEDEEFFLAQELVEGHILQDELKVGQSLDEAYVINFLSDLLTTLEFVHQQQVIHRDLKPSNLIRRKRDQKIVVIDFGAVKEVSTQTIGFGGNTSSIVIGSPGYMPNEQFAGKTQFASDVYAVGVIVIQALTGLSPNQIPENPQTSELAWQDYGSDVARRISPQLRAIIEKMVRYDFRQRYQNATEVLRALRGIQSGLEALPTVSMPAIASQMPSSMATANQERDELRNTPHISQRIAAVGRELAAMPEAMRLKKLICLVCSGILENDSSRLEQIMFEDCVQSLYEQCANPDALKASLLQAVKTITPNKQRQYVLLAKQVFQAVVVLYARNVNHSVGASIGQKAPMLDGSQNPTQSPTQSLTQSQNVTPPSVASPMVIDPPPVAPVQVVMPPIEQLVIHAGAVSLQSPEPSLYQAPVNPEELAINEAAYTYGDSYGSVLRAMSQHSQHFRLKKLLLYVCQDVWESNLQRLLSYNWGQILADFVGFAPTYESASQVISQAIERISKKDEYVNVAQLLLELIAPLLNAAEYNNYANYGDNNGSFVASEYSGEPVESLPDPNFVGSPTGAVAPVAFSPARPSPAVVMQLKEFEPELTKDLFDTKLDLMRFANPLRAKILLFSQLYYGFIPDIHDWSDMRNHDLDFLLRQSFYSCPTYEFLRDSLLRTARSLPEPEAYEPAVGYVLRVLTPFYDLLKEKHMRHPAADDSRGNQAGTGNTSSGGNNNISLDEEQTCQFVEREPMS